MLTRWHLVVLLSSYAAVLPAIAWSEPVTGAGPGPASAFDGVYEGTFMSMLGSDAGRGCYSNLNARTMIKNGVFTLNTISNNIKHTDHFPLAADGSFDGKVEEREAHGTVRGEALEAHVSFGKCLFVLTMKKRVP